MGWSFFSVLADLCRCCISQIKYCEGNKEDLDQWWLFQGMAWLVEPASACCAFRAPDLSFTVLAHFHQCLANTNWVREPSPFFPSQLSFLPAGCLGPSSIALILSRSRISRWQGWAGLKAACPGSLGTLEPCWRQPLLSLPPCPPGVHLCNLPVPIRGAVFLWRCVPVCAAHAVLMLWMTSLARDSTNWDWHMQHVDI